MSQYSAFHCALSDLQNNEKQLISNDLRFCVVNPLKVAFAVLFHQARHTWATTAQRLSIPTRVISESMGHTDEATTHIYLASFDIDQIDAANRKILKAVSPAKARKAAAKKAESPATMLLSEMPTVAYCSTSTQYIAPSDSGNSMNGQACQSD